MRGLVSIAKYVRWIVVIEVGIQSRSCSTKLIRNTSQGIVVFLPFLVLIFLNRYANTAVTLVNFRVFSQNAYINLQRESASGLNDWITYWDKLESVNTSINSPIYNPRIWVFPSVSTSTTSLTSTLQSGTQPTGTPTPTTTLTLIAGTTQTPTRTITVTPLGSSPTINFSSQSITPSVQDGGSLTPLPNPVDIVTQTFSVPVTATTTLIPMPAFTLVFPTLTAIPTSTKTPPPSIEERLVNLDEGRIFMVGIILIIWIVLGGWFYFSLQRLKK